MADDRRAAADQIEGGAAGTGTIPSARVRIGVKTTAKGEVYCEFTVEVEADSVHETLAEIADARIRIVDEVMALKFRYEYELDRESHTASERLSAIHAAEAAGLIGRGPAGEAIGDVHPEADALVAQALRS